MNPEQKLEHNLLGKQLAAAFDRFKQSPPQSLNRNDPCWCGSGLKYKKCCLAKGQQPDSSSVQLESYQIKSEALTPEEAQNRYPALPPEDQELMEELYMTVHEQPDVIDSEDCEYFQTLNALRSKHPDYPVILNYLVNGYELLGQPQRASELLAEMYENFPDYLFGQTATAHSYLRNGSPEKAIAVLNGASSLKQLYPHRTVFHVTELRAFEHFMVRYFCSTGNLNQAEAHLQLMERALEEDDELLLAARMTVCHWKMLSDATTGISRLIEEAQAMK